MASKREALIASAEKSLQKGKPDAALKDYLKALEEAPNDINILGKVGDLLVRLNRNEESIPYFTRIAEHYARDGFYVKAIAMYKKINRLDPSRLEIYEKLAELYTKQGLGMEAKSNYQVLADYLLKQDNTGGAIGIYQKMVAIEPANLQLHVKLADLFTQAKRIPEALKEYAVVASALGERGAHEEAIRVYEKALRLAPDNLDVLKTLVPLLVSINALDHARQILRKALETTPRSVALFLLSAEVALAANDMAEARSFGSKAQAVDPDNEEVLSTVVRIQLKGRRPDLAFAAAAPLADIAVRRGEAKKAVALLVPIARAAPDNEDLLRKVIEVASGAGDEATALPYRSALAEILRKQGKLAEAAEVLRTCARLAPDNAEFRARLAQIEPAAAGAVGTVRTVDVRPEEVTLSGLEGLRRGAQPQAAPPARPAAPPERPVTPPPAPAGPSDEFEFDLADEDLVEEPRPAPAVPPPARPAVRPPAEAPVPVSREAWAPTPPRGVPGLAPRQPADRASGALDVEWGSVSAAEAIEAYETGQQRAAQVPVDEGVEELGPAQEVGFQDVPARRTGPPLDWGAVAPDVLPGAIPVSPALSWDVPGTQGAPAGSLLAGSLDWDLSGIPPVPTVAPGGARGGSSEAEIDEALVEAEVFRKYGLLDKAVDQLSPFVAIAPSSVKLREKLFEIYLEQGHRDKAAAEAEVLRVAYGQEGRAERIRGLDALLGVSPGVPVVPEPVRSVVPEPDFPVAPPSLELSIPSVPVAADAFDPGPTVRLDWPPPQARKPVAPQPLPVPLEAPPEPVISPDVAHELAPGFDVDFTPGPAPAAIPAELPALAADFDQAPEPLGARTPAGSLLMQGPEVGAGEPLERMEAVDWSAALAPAPEAPAPASPAAGLEVTPPEPGLPAAAPPVETHLAEVVQPAVPLRQPEERRAPRPVPSPDDLLNLEPPPAAVKKKVARLTADDIQLDLLARPAAPKPAKPKVTPSLPELPADLLARPAAREEKPRSPAPSQALPGDILESLGVAPRPRVPVPPRPPQGVSLQAPAPAAPPEQPSRPTAPAAGSPALSSSVPTSPPVAHPTPPPAAFEPLPGPSADDLAEVDFCLDQGMVVDAAERLQSLESRFPLHPDVAARRQRLEGARGTVGETVRPALHDILSEDLDSVLDAELGRALSDEMVRGSAEAGPEAPRTGSVPIGPSVDESGLFSDEQEFFNFADELRTELKKESTPAASSIEGPGQEVSLEEIFRDFKKGVEQQLSPEDYETHYNLGIAYKEMGLTDEAIGEFQLAAKDPLHAVECCSMLGLCFLEKGLPQLAVKWYRKGLETLGIREDDKLGLMYDLATVLEQIGDRDAAYRTYLDIYGINAGFRDVNDRLKALRPATA